MIEELRKRYIKLFKLLDKKEIPEFLEIVEDLKYKGKLQVSPREIVHRLEMFVFIGQNKSFELTVTSFCLNEDLAVPDDFNCIDDFLPCIEGIIGLDLSLMSIAEKNRAMTEYALKK